MTIAPQNMSGKTRRLCGMKYLKSSMTNGLSVFRQQLGAIERFLLANRLTTARKLAGRDTMLAAWWAISLKPPVGQ